MKADGFRSEQIDIQRSLDMRYVGQVHECTVEIGNFKIDGKTIEKVKEAFHRRHEELYTYAERHSPVEVVNIESTLYGRVDKPKPPRLSEGVTPAKALKGTPQGGLRRQRQGPTHAGLRRRAARRRGEDRRPGDSRGGDHDPGDRAGLVRQARRERLLSDQAQEAAQRRPMSGVLSSGAVPVSFAVPSGAVGTFRWRRPVAPEAKIAPSPATSP